MAIETPPKRIIIIGAGLAGPVLALSLRRQGIVSEIFELRSELSTFGAGITMAPNACRVLDDLGIYQRVKKGGYSFEELYLRGDNAKDLGFHYQGHEVNNGYKATRIERTKLHKILLDAAEEVGTKIHFGRKFVSYEDGPDGVAVKFDDGSVEVGDLLVGCDGWHSKVRTQMLGREIKPIYSGFSGIAGFAKMKDLKLPSPDYKLPFMIFSKNGHFGFTPIDSVNEKATWFVSCQLKEQTREELSDFTMNHALDYAKDLLKDVGEPVTSILNSQKKSEVNIHAHYIVPEIETWHRGRVVIMGDAAHCIPPHGGQGAAQAFEDSYLLSLELAAISKTWTLEDALIQWHGLRAPRLKTVAEVTESSGNIRKQAGYLKQLFKEWTVWAYFKLWPGEVGAKLYSYDLKKVQIGR